MWVKLDDGFADHPKMFGISDKAFRLHVRAMCYAARHLTDGFVPGNMGDRKPTDELVKAGLWSEVQNGYQIHDYLEYNPPREKILAQREAERQRKSGRNPGGSGPDVKDPVPVPRPKSETKGADAPEIEIPPGMIHKVVISTAKRAEVDKPASKGPSELQDGLLKQLWEIDGWKALSHGALVKLNGAHTRPVVTMALQRAREERRAPNGSAYGLIESMCRDIAAKGAGA